MVPEARSPNIHTIACYVIKSHGGLMLVDAGGGNGIFNAINESGIKLSEIHHIFITHTHTDHILGAVWLIRVLSI